jgi:hypothetical protein
VPLSSSQVVEQARFLKGYHRAERAQLDVVRRYLKGRQALPAVIPSTARAEVRVMARSSRVNVMPIVVNSLVQSMFVDGFRSKREADDLEVWSVWQANRMDARQTGIHRAASTYGTAYAIVLPGDPVPVIRGASPRTLTAVYGEDPDWPMSAIERLGNGLWRVFDEEAAYYVSEAHSRFEHVETREHGMGVTPVVRFLDEEDLDADDEVEPAGHLLGANTTTRGQVAPLMPLQDQIDMTTFGLQIAQHYGAFRQRYILGWVADDEQQLMKVGASQLMSFDVDASEVTIGEFGQTNLEGYIGSRDATLSQVASLSQTPVHELTGKLVNLSAEALAAAEAGKDRKVEERQSLAGESHEQTMTLVGRLMGVDVPDDAQVVWRDTSARAFAATVDGLGKLATMLGIPPQELWERVPGATRQDVERWKTTAATGNAFADLTNLLDRQADPVT